MKHLFRLAWLLLTYRFRSPVPTIGPVRTAFRVWLTDLDVLMHVNNGVYLSLMDLGRVDLMLRSGMLRQVRSRGWYPVVVAQTIQYRRSLKLLDRFDIETRVLAWDDKAILLAQEFRRPNGEAIATALVRGRFLSSAGTVPMSELIGALGNPSPPAEVPAYAREWNAAQASWQGS
jgi:YbgC/YbaW family acyl-CoA thioester hydrolase